MNTLDVIQSAKEYFIIFIRDIEVKIEPDDKEVREIINLANLIDNWSNISKRFSNNLTKFDGISISQASFYCKGPYTSKNGHIVNILDGKIAIYEGSEMMWQYDEMDEYVNHLVIVIVGPPNSSIEEEINERFDDLEFNIITDNY